jgi:hypothetical protein
MIALEELGFGPCYHMRDLLADLEGGLPLWERVAQGSPAQGSPDEGSPAQGSPGEGAPGWEAIFGDARSTVDWPSARYYRELMDHYPDAKVLLSVRDSDAWVRSMRATVWGIFHGDSVLHHVCEARAVLDPLWQRYCALMRHMTWNPRTGALAGDSSTDEGLATLMEDWNDTVRSTVPADRLLVWDPAEGWEPLCEFLEVDVPAEPLPHVNDTLSFREGIIGDAIAVVNQWWQERERPSTGLHGAALS